MDNNIIFELFDMIKQMPWYAMVIYVFGIIAQLCIIFFLLALFPPVVKALFTADFAGICICIYNCFQEKKVDENMVTLMVVFFVLLAVLFFIIGGTDENYSGIVSMFFGSLLEGALNLLMLCACMTIVLIPLGAMIWNRNDRYS